jgi:DNA-directed RNA polymerase specialized sigma24 family protein
MEDRRNSPSSETEAKAARACFDEEIRGLLRQGEGVRATRDALRTYGPELFGFVVGAVDDREAAGVAYADACRRMEREIAAFRWSCPLRTWMYAIVRQQLGRHRESASRRPTASPSSFELPDPTRTISRRPATRRAAIAALRMRLPPEDRELLILRLDRSLDWLDIAITTLGCDAPAIELARESNRVRARMRALREELSRAVQADELRR